MSWVGQALRDLGKQMGLDDLRFNERGVCFLQVEGGDEMVLEDRGARILVCYSRKRPHLEEKEMERLLRTTHYRSGVHFPCGVCLAKEDRVVFFTYLERSQVTSAALQQRLALVRKLHEKDI